MPLRAMASAISRTTLSLTPRRNLFQLFQPIGGVFARLFGGHGAHGRERNLGWWRRERLGRIGRDLLRQHRRSGTAVEGGHLDAQALRRQFRGVNHLEALAKKFADDGEGNRLAVDRALGDRRIALRCGNVAGEFAAFGLEGENRAADVSGWPLGFRNPLSSEAGRQSHRRQQRTEGPRENVLHVREYSAAIRDRASSVFSSGPTARAWLPG